MHTVYHTNGHLNVTVKKRAAPAAPAFLKDETCPADAKLISFHVILNCVCT